MLIYNRSVQPNSLSIWTHHLNSIRWFDTSFTPKGCKFAINGPAVTVGSGSQWRDIHRSAQGKGVGVVGGAFESVSVGGYLANGGHGHLSAKYGLGADMVLEIDLVNAGKQSSFLGKKYTLKAVNAEGEYITANECQNQDYFWAMRGGGVSYFTTL
jgi:FAD/FMN-containing dehydrogenase